MTIKVNILHNFSLPFEKIIIIYLIIILYQIDALRNRHSIKFEFEFQDL